MRCKLLFLTGLLVATGSSARAGLWLFEIDNLASEMNLEATIDLGALTDSDRATSPISGYLLVDLDPDEPPRETIRILRLRANPTRRQLKLNYGFGPLNLLGTVKVTMKDLQIAMEPEQAGPAVSINDNGRFIQEENRPSVSGTVEYSANVLTLKQSGEIKLSDAEAVPEDELSGSFPMEGEITQHPTRPKLSFALEIEREMEPEELEGSTVTVSFKGVVVAHGKRLPKPRLAIRTVAAHKLEASWSPPGNYHLEIARDIEFLEPETIDVKESTTSHLIEVQPGKPGMAFIRLGYSSP